MPILFATKGLSGSGKSTLALEMINKNPKLKRVNRDELRRMVDGGKWSQKREKTIVKTRDTLIGMYLSDGFDVISDDTNLHPAVMERLKQLAHEHGAEFKIIDLTHVSYEECVKRDLNRLHSVGEQVIKRQWLDYLCQPKQEPDPNLDWCVIVDLDGTVADISHRNPYDASTCEQDGVRQHVVATVNGLLTHTFPNGPLPYLFFFSGRSEEYREPTERWLESTFDRGYDYLHMRKAGDTRKDSVIKRELYEEHVKGKYNVIAVVDDRPQVIRLWKSLGLNVIDVSEKIGLEF